MAKEHAPGGGLFVVFYSTPRTLNLIQHKIPVKEKIAGFAAGAVQRARRSSSRKTWTAETGCLRINPLGLAQKGGFIEVDDATLVGTASFVDDPRGLPSFPLSQYGGDIIVFDRERFFG